MCFHNSINASEKSLGNKYKKKLKAHATYKPIFHANGFEFLEWPIVTASSNEIEIMNWGLIPNWAKTPTDAFEIRTKTLNARIESAEEKPSFKNAKRCIVPSTGFFEWQTVGNTKVPYFIYLPDAPIFSMAGLYDKWVDEKGNLKQTFSILTTEANPLMERIHNLKKRMPVILDTETEALWIENLRPIDNFIKPFDEEKMKAHTISQIISSKNHNVPEVSLPKIIEVSEQLNLF
jgi:putative SOS response-associated peptidase YedK